MTDVKVLARWEGWCSPCEQERPLVLTEAGQRGLQAWLHGIGPEDRALTLTCRICGVWQSVPLDEADDPDIAYVDDEAEAVVEAAPVVEEAPEVADEPVVPDVPLILSTGVTGRPSPAPRARPTLVRVPVPRSEPPTVVDVSLSLHELLAQGYDVVSSRAS